MALVAVVAALVVFVYPGMRYDSGSTKRSRPHVGHSAAAPAPLRRAAHGKGHGHGHGTPSPPAVAAPSAVADPTSADWHRALRRQPLLISRGQVGSSKLIALTFDADMTQGMQSLLARHTVASFADHATIAYLHSSHTPATIFMTGLWAEQYPTLARSLAGDPGLEIENHSFDHRGWFGTCFGLPLVKPQSSAAAKRAEVRQAADDLARYANVVPHLFRFPGGCYGPGDTDVVAAAGERAVQWSIDSGDAFNPDAAAIARHVIASAAPGGIVVMHLVGAPNAPATAASLHVIVPALLARGYRFVTMAQLLSVTPT